MNKKYNFTENEIQNIINDYVEKKIPLYKIS